MKRMFMSFIAVFFPWVILLMDDNPGGAVVALIMQATIVGWLPASLWALRIIREKAMAERIARVEAEKAAYKAKHAQPESEEEKTKP